jgi:CobQ/CobB/MinD/ParA nucleotide binding domain
MANIHLIGGEKGGVGKSLVARILAQYLIDKKLPFLGFDTDRSHGALMRFYAGFASPILVDRYEALDTIVEAAVAQPDRRILVDLAAQTHESFVKWMDESGVLDLAEEAGIAIHYWHVMDGGKDSVDLLSKLLDRFANRLRYVLVLNQVRGDDFSILAQSGEEARAVALGARKVSIKRLNESAIQKIDARSTSFWAAANAAEKETTGLGLMDRQRVKMWLRAAYGEIEAVGV